MPKIGKNQKSKATTPQKKKGEDSVWDEINDMGGEYESRAVYNFFVSADKSAEVVFVSAYPRLLPIHSMKKTITKKDGTSYSIYPNVPCSKDTGKTCGYCDEAKVNSLVKARTKGIFWALIDLRGKREDGEYNGEPAFKWFERMPKNTAMKVRDSKEQLEDEGLELWDIVFKVTKKSGMSADIEPVYVTEGKGRNAKKTYKFVETNIDFDEEDNPVKIEISDDGEVLFDGEVPLLKDIWKPDSPAQMNAELDGIATED